MWVEAAVVVDSCRNDWQIDGNMVECCVARDFVDAAEFHDFPQLLVGVIPKDVHLLAEMVPVFVDFENPEIVALLHEFLKVLFIDLERFACDFVRRVFALFVAL